MRCRSAPCGGGHRPVRSSGCPLVSRSQGQSTHWAVGSLGQCSPVCVSALYCMLVQCNLGQYSTVWVSAVQYSAVLAVLYSGSFDV